MLVKLVKPYHGALYSVFRVIVGLLFAQHGAQKLFGAFGGLGGNSVFGGGVELASLMSLAGFIEFFGGLAIALGLFTRIAALIAAVEMAVAYFMAHLPQNMVPLLNQGEPALLFLASFLVLLAYGAGKWGLEQALMKKEMF